MTRTAIRINTGRWAVDSDERNHNLLEKLDGTIRVAYWCYAGRGYQCRALPYHLHLMVHGQLPVVWDGAALVAPYIAAVTPSCDLPGLQSGRQGVERTMDRGTGDPAFCVPSNPCGIGKLRFRVYGFVSGGVSTRGVPRLLPFSGARGRALLLDCIRAC